ncbi:prepilin-type N-terminal cleavage/methylation domain-containing protein [Algisphaera agarilytica]|uniref:Prepilin-type N-terminal cleavage/methylation domain-containing protein n=1 Tax=Algisphaera agarilytica TaxID=1385975 RepID=A0A7X0H928_9BACT|nr:prepilin-type N-terminal cleavage/methylation domain-containing protein [Algisphaera agarilytica]MBB6431471.1 prepilin-type N-terminal cleavage/methylation domain-containing protein [Algisphaera agarilytica]
MKNYKYYNLRRTCDRGFTLIELIVAIAIIGLMVGLSFPVLQTMQQSSRVSSATNTVSVAVDAARSLAATENNFAIGVLPGGLTGNYDGTAIIFTPSGECRLVVNDQLAVNGAGNPLELLTPPKNGYRDIEGRDYIILPKGTGVAGMRRNTNATSINGLVFVPPPFAVAFDENGKLIVGTASASSDRAVYYDKDADGDYTTGDGRPGGYNPDDWDARINPGVATVGDISDPKNRLRYELPYEQIETVTAIVIYDKQTFDVDTGGWGSASAADIQAFMTQDDDTLAKIFFFSPTTGAIIRN